jgi:hypothetical protein
MNNTPSDPLRKALDAEIGELMACRKDCTRDLREFIDYFDRMAAAAVGSGDPVRVRSVLEAIRDSRRAGHLRWVPNPELPRELTPW